MKKNCGQVVTFYYLVKFVETEADLATDPVFSPDVLKSERNKRFEKGKNPRDKNRRPLPNLNRLLTATGDPPKSSSPAPDSKTSSSSIICPVCSKPHTPAVMNSRRKLLKSILTLYSLQVFALVVSARVTTQRIAVRD